MDTKTTSTKRALIMDPVDDVATVIDAVAAGDTVSVRTKSGDTVDELVALEDIPRFHKICLAPLATGQLAHKYGEVIGVMTADVARGGYVHVHTIESVKTGVSA